MAGTPVDGTLVPSPQIQVANTTLLSQAIDTFVATNKMPTANEFRARIGQPFVGGIINQIPGLEGSASLVGTWEATHYANDLANKRQPKLKFLFKVRFVGFTTREFYYFVHSIDKPKVNFVHTDVNYYNFRTKVLTHVTFDPITVSFWDEIGNSVNEFFKFYLQNRSGQGSGGWGTNYGFGLSSSSKPYERTSAYPNAPYGYSAGQQIIVEQIFANGSNTNRFIFINPRIETLQFDNLDMSDSSPGSSLTCTFNYDALSVQTIPYALSYRWGMNDLLKGGSVAGINGGSPDGSDPLDTNPRSADNTGGTNSVGVSPIAAQPDQEYANLQEFAARDATTATAGATNEPNRDLTPAVASDNPVVSSAETRVQADARQTYESVSSGANMQTGGSDTKQVASPGSQDAFNSTQSTRQQNLDDFKSGKVDAQEYNRRQAEVDRQQAAHFRSQGDEQTAQKLEATAASKEQRANTTTDLDRRIAENNAQRRALGLL